MKKKVLSFVAAIFVAFSFTGCNDTDESVVGYASEDLLGIWEMVSCVYSGSSSVTSKGITNESIYRGVFKNISSNLIVLHNPNEIKVEGSYDIDLTYSILGGVSQKKTAFFTDISNTVDWSLRGDILTMSGVSFSLDIPIDMGTIPETGTNISQDFIVEELTDSKLRIQTYSEKCIEASGVSSKIKTNMILEFIR